MATILYARVSTIEQTIEHQLMQAEAAGFRIDQVVADHGVSGVTVAFKERPNGKRLFDMLRGGDSLVVRWVDRLGRNYGDVRDTIQEFMRRGVVVRTVINNLTFDGASTDPMQQAVRDALIGFLAATAQANAEAIKEAQRGGIALARAKEGGIKYRGRKPSFTHRQLTTVREMDGQSVGEIAKATGLSRQTIYRIKADPVAAESMLANWAT
ncbi:recombinase family protein [Rhodopseudomonas palustris]|uniref:Recombinase family protein n=1 Tax=Rhodopseudomonas palustris TaxID=1076 RepID=A0AAX3DX44_RHOPL|nr:recombinase family protein [Rhodopseudomonas palustris]UYO39432.1 recombinase family protein [Rhodopseudomonas palustris]